jgi:hypothetical protein
VDCKLAILRRFHMEPVKYELYKEINIKCVECKDFFEFVFNTKLPKKVYFMKNVI